MSCPKCALQIERIGNLRDRKDWYVNENKRLRALCAEQTKHLAALEAKIKRMEEQCQTN